MRIALPVLALVALAGCTVYVPEPDALMAGGDEERLPDLRAGRELYINKCSGCHSLIPVDRYDARRWESEVDEMFRLKKVRMSVDERGQLLRYLSAASDPGLRPK
jgi:hypothetical protein